MPIVEQPVGSLGFPAIHEYGPMNTPPPLISVIIPSYNYAKYLPECIESVRAQSYPAWEAVIVDDGSSDGTEQIAPALIANDPRISYFRKENGGVSKARNFGIQHSRGEYILPLDADDLLAPTALEDLCKALRNDPESGFAYCGLENYRGLPSDVAEWYPGYFLRSRIVDENLSACSALWRRSLFEAGVQYRQVLYEDWDLWLQIVARGFRGAYVPKPLLKYRIHRLGRHTLNKHRYFQAYLQEMQLNRNLYPEDFTSLADRALRYAPGCFDKPTLVLVPNPNSEDFTEFRGGFKVVADEFLKRGHFVLALANYAASETLPDGCCQIRTPSALTPAILEGRLYMAGRELIVCSSLPEGEIGKLRISQNAFTILSMSPTFQPEADISVFPHGTELLMDQGGVSVPPKICTVAEGVDAVLARHRLLVKEQRNRQNAFNERLYTLAHASPEDLRRPRPSPGTTLWILTIDSEVGDDEATALTKLAVEPIIRQEERCIVVIPDQREALAQRISDTHQIPVRIGSLISNDELCALLNEHRANWGAVLPVVAAPTEDSIALMRTYQYELGNNAVFIAESARSVPLQNTTPMAYRPINRSACCFIVHVSTLKRMPALPALPTKSFDPKLFTYLTDSIARCAWLPAPFAIEHWRLEGRVPQFDRAKIVELFQRSERTTRERCEILIAWGDELLALNFAQHAQRAFEDAAILEPNDPLPKLGLSRALLARGSLGLAGHCALQALALSPENTLAQQILETIRKIEMQP